VALKDNNIGKLKWALWTMAFVGLWATMLRTTRQSFVSLKTRDKSSVFVGIHSHGWAVIFPSDYHTRFINIIDVGTAHPSPKQQGKEEHCVVLLMLWSSD